MPLSKQPQAGAIWVPQQSSRPGKRLQWVPHPHTAGAQRSREGEQAVSPGWLPPQGTRTLLQPSHLHNRSLQDPTWLTWEGFVLTPSSRIFMGRTNWRGAGKHQAVACLQQLLQTSLCSRSHRALCVHLGMETKSQGHVLSHLAKNTSKTSLLAAWCQQDLEMLTELIFAQLSLVILVLSCLKGRVPLKMTEGGGPPLLTRRANRAESRRQQPLQKHSHVFAPTSSRGGSGSYRDPLNCKELKVFITTSRS